MEKDALRQLIHSINFTEAGVGMHQLMKKLYPICRSITGDGVRETFRIINNEIPLEVSEVPTGKDVFDWTIPKEWNINDAYVKDSKGSKIIDFNESNLHVLNYSIPVHKNVTLGELKKHIFTIPESPDLIPYRTSYYNETWGFCLSHNQFLGLKDDTCEVYIDSSLTNGHLTYGEYFIKGELSDEVLISVHTCHPSLCNDNLSGICLATSLAKHLSTLNLRYSYRFVFIPGTIGSITWLSMNEKTVVPKIKHGLVAVCLGDSGKFTYKKTRNGNEEIDQIAINALQHSGQDYEVIDFFPYGYDERQYCSPGFDLPVGCLMRTPHGQYKEYHTSGDDLEFVKPEMLAGSLALYLSVISSIENNRYYLNTNPQCEPQLGKRGIYDKIGGHNDSKKFQLALLWVLNLSDGENSLLDISNRAKLSFDIIFDAAHTLLEHDLLREKD